MNQDQNRGGYINGLVTGMILGAVTVFLLGTEQGRRLSGKIRKGSKKTLAELEDVLGEIEDKVEDKKAAIGEKATEVAEEWGDRVQEVKEDVATMMEPELNYIEKLQEQGRVATQRFFHKSGKALG